jgi:hypothetical protein
MWIPNSGSQTRPTAPELPGLNLPTESDGGRKPPFVASSFTTL